jgi:hypothetical protein
LANEDEKPIRIVDRRMFTPEGELRPDYQPEEPAPPPPPLRAKGAAPQAAPDRPAARAETAAGEPPEGAAETAEPRSDFASLVRSLATTAYSALGLLPDPAGARRRDPPVAQQMIDWLTMLEGKTRGNISFEESDLLSKVLYDLRLAYVEVTRSPL